MFKNLATLILRALWPFEICTSCTLEHTVFIIIKEGNGEASVQGYLDPSCLPPEQSDLTVVS